MSTPTKKQLLAAQSRLAQSANKTATKKQTKAKQQIKDDGEYIDEGDDIDEESIVVEEMIQSLEAQLVEKPQKPQKSSPKRKGSINIKEYEMNEAEEVKSKKSKIDDGPTNSKSRQTWSSAETVCLKLMILGCSPIGKSAARMNNYYLLLIKSFSIRL